LLSDPVGEKPEFHLDPFVKWAIFAAFAFAAIAALALRRRAVAAAGQLRVVNAALELVNAELQRKEERYALAVSAANDGIWDWDLTEDRIHLSPRWHAILGRSEPGETGDDVGDGNPAVWFDLVHPDDLLRLRSAIDAHLAGHTPQLLSQHRMLHAAGGWRWVLTRGLAIRGTDGQPTRMAGSLSDVTDRVGAEHRLQRDALHDGLTGLPNRALLMDRVAQSIQRAAGSPELGCAVLYLDIDRLGLINDSFSHAVGDRVLVALAGRVANALRPGDTVARIGGGEFAALLEGVVSTQEAISVATRVQRSVREPFGIDGHELSTTASIGVALARGGADPQEVLRKADIAMYGAKRQGRNRCALFEENMHRHVVDRPARQDELREAVEQSLLPIHYQPIVDLATGRIRVLEALARWPEGRPAVGPRDFIPIAEEAGVIGALGLHVLRTALETLAGWRRLGIVDDDVRISVNISSRQLDDPGLPGAVRAAIAAAGLDGGALRLELTENALMQEPQWLGGILREVCSTGVRLLLDDFGTGFSSLAALHEFPIDALKVDRSFVASINSAVGESEVIVRSTIALAHSLGLQVIAEGIEDPRQLRRLRTLGCEYGQGFLFSPPLAAADAQVLLCQWDTERVAALGDRVAPA
jgi:diguanylate cyclase (GGDEF)-like protein/PAS domain S-box-containing protein